MQVKKKVCYIISHVNKSLAFEWIANGLKDEVQLEFVLLNETGSPLQKFLLESKILVRLIRYRGKRDFILVFIKVFFLLLKRRPNVVHTHLLDAQLIGLTAAWLLRIPKRIYTRHNSNFHQVYHPKGVKYDRWSNFISTQIVSISQATYTTLVHLEKVDPKKIVNIPHGFDLAHFENRDRLKIDSLQRKWKMEDRHPCIGVIARHIEWKGIQYIIPAFQRFIEQYPNAILILANAQGPYHTEILRLLKSISHKNYVLIPFEEDVASLYHSFDMYVHTPIDRLSEAFGQTYVEALGAGVPSVFTLSGIAAEFISNNENALTVDFKNSGTIFNALLQLWSDEPLRKKLSMNGKKSVERFALSNMLLRLKELYA